MNETIQTILKRRACRAYTAEAVNPDDVRRVVDCGLWAPSAMNRQDWHFAVVQSPELIRQMSDEIRAQLPQPARERYKQRHGGREDFSMFYGAPVVIVVSVDGSESYAQVDGGLATENMCLAAESLGLGSCVIGLTSLLFASPEAAAYREKLRIPEGYNPIHAVVIGHPAANSAPPERLPGRVDYIG